MLAKLTKSSELVALAFAICTRVELVAFILFHATQIAGPRSSGTADLMAGVLADGLQMVVAVHT
jgi:hypothetical protein